jgi:hypothetical protein
MHDKQLTNAWSNRLRHAAGDIQFGGEDLASTGANNIITIGATALGLGLIVAGAAIVARPRRTSTRRH